MTTIQFSPAATAFGGMAPDQANGAGAGANACEGAAQSIDALIYLVQKLNIDMRDLERQFSGKLQSIVFDRQMTALQMKKEAILKNFDASVLHAAGQIASGAVGCLGTLSGSEIARGLSEAGGKTIEGETGWMSASTKRDAEQSQLDGEVQDQFAKQFEKSLDQALDRANEASQQLVQTTAELVALQSRIKEAVRF